MTIQFFEVFWILSTTVLGETKLITPEHSQGHKISFELGRNSSLELSSEQNCFFGARLSLASTFLKILVKVDS